MGRTRRVVVGALTAAVAGLGLPVLADVGVAAAAPTELFVSEYIEGTSNNKALEIYNGTGAAVDLTAGAYNVQMFFNGSATAGLTINLAGTVAAGDVFVLAQASANATILAQADQTNAAGWFNGDDAVVLRRGTTVLDVIGQIGVDPGTEWGTGVTSTADNTLRRKPPIEAGDPNGADAFDPAVEWDGFATDSFGDLGSHLSPALTCAPVSGDAGTAIDAPVSAADVNGTVVDISLSSVAPSDPGTITRTAFTPAAAVGGTATATFTASAATPAGVYTLTITATNDDGIPQTGTCALTIGVNTVPVCGDPATSISAVQGSGAATPISGQIVTIEGVVVGDYQGAGQFGGYYVQEEDADHDGDPATSEGVFVFNTSASVSAGDVVRVTGRAGEFSGQTQLSNVTETAVCEPTGATVTAASMTLPVAAVSDWERVEGMLTSIAQQLTVTEVFTLGRFGEVDLSVGGRLETPTNAVAPGAPALALQDLNNRSRIVLDDGNNQQNIDPTLYPQGGLSASNTLRVGDTLPSLTGVLGFGFSEYRVQPVGPIAFTHANPRPPAPAPVGGEVRAAAFNVLNYFNGDGAGGGFPTERGANTPAEFARQRDKIIAAITTLDADVVGLMELENDDTDAELGAIEDLVAGLNAATAPGTYAFIDTGVVGTDAIRVGILYQPATVTPVGAHAVIDSTVDPRFIDTLNRPSIAQTFEANADGARFTVVVNHLKSKGSDCNHVGDPDAGDGQGNCNLTRTAAAEAIVDWLATDPTGSGDADFLILGDLNAYAMEDPITAFRDAGYVDTIAEFVGDDGYSFVFDGMSGYLDHALASPSLAAQVAGVSEWHINADEPIVLDYNVEFKSPNHVTTLYAPDQFRSSDHDPVLVGLGLNAAPTVDAGGPYAVIEGGSVTVSATGSDPDGDSLTYAWDLDGNGSFETPGASATFSAAGIEAPAVRTISVQATDPDGLVATDSATVHVIWDFDGFFPPVANPPALNRVNAGQTVVVSFSLGGDQGLDVLDSAVSTPVSCSTGLPIGPSQTAATPGASGLVYDAGTDTYTFTWKTSKGFAGSCRRLTVTLADGTVHDADFRFVR
jgi:predicted extracellular nuclease